MKLFMKWIVFHIAGWAVIYAAFYENIEGAMYLLKFFLWLMAPLTAVLLTKLAVSSSAKNKPAPKALSALSTAQLWATLGLLIWFGHVFTALACAFIMAVTAIHRSLVSDARALKQ